MNKNDITMETLTESFKSLTTSLISNLSQLDESNQHAFVANWIEKEGFEPESLDELVAQHNDGTIHMNAQQLFTANKLLTLFI